MPKRKQVEPHKSNRHCVLDKGHLSDCLWEFVFVTYLIIFATFINRHTAWPTLGIWVQYTIKINKINKVSLITHFRWTQARFLEIHIMQILVFFSHTPIVSIMLALNCKSPVCLHFMDPQRWLLFFNLYVHLKKVNHILLGWHKSE